MVTKSLWLRLYTEITRDRKLRRMDIKLRWIWITLLCMAKESPVPGKLLIATGIAATAEDIADEAAANLADIQNALEQFIAMNMVDQEPGGCYELVHWEARQYEYPSNTPAAAAQRKRKSRAQNRESRKSHKNVTSLSQASHALDTDTETDTEEKDTGECEGLPLVSPEETPTGKKRRTKKTGHSCPSSLREGVLQQADTVYLKSGEVESLTAEFGPEGVRRMVAILDAYKTNNRKKCAEYVDDYKVITAWVTSRYREECDKQSRASPRGLSPPSSPPNPVSPFGKHLEG